MPLDIQIVSMTKEQGQQICSWRYPGLYAVYNWPSWEHLAVNNLQFANNEIRQSQFYAVITMNNQIEQLSGFAQLFPMMGLTRLGLGLRPDLCGKGMGTLFVNKIVRYAIQKNPGHEIDLEVHVWNKRAQIVYTRAGFVITDQYERKTINGQEEFYCMVFDP